MLLTRKKMVEIDDVAEVKLEIGQTIWAFQNKVTPIACQHGFIINDTCQHDCYKCDGKEVKKTLELTEITIETIVFKPSDEIVINRWLHVKVGVKNGKITLPKSIMTNQAAAERWYNESSLKKD
jgi:hypothetical protein